MDELPEIHIMAVSGKVGLPDYMNYVEAYRKAITHSKTIDAFRSQLNQDSL
jgi:uncharacterized short protein YbdD (DUF466 family)